MLFAISPVPEWVKPTGNRTSQIRGFDTLFTSFRATQPPLGNKIHLMPIFNYTFTVNAPLADVANFHSDTSALKTLSPGPMQIHRADPLGEGSISEFTLWLGPIPVRWRALHSNVSQNGFTDSQESGPVEFWQHTHTFTALAENQTRIDEHIEYRHHKGLRGIFSRLVFGKLGLLVLFTYRQWATIRALKK